MAIQNKGPKLPGSGWNPLSALPENRRRVETQPDETSPTSVPTSPRETTGDAPPGAPKLALVHPQFTADQISRGAPEALSPGAQRAYQRHLDRHRAEATQLPPGPYNTPEALEAYLNHFLRHGRPGAVDGLTSEEIAHGVTIKGLLTEPPSARSEALLARVRQELQRQVRKKQTTLRSVDALLTDAERVLAIGYGTVLPSTKEGLVKAVNAELARGAADSGVGSLHALVLLPPDDDRAVAIGAKINARLARLRARDGVKPAFRRLEHWTQLLSPEDYLIAAAQGHLDPRADASLRMLRAKVDMLLVDRWHHDHDRVSLSNPFVNAARTPDEYALVSTLHALKALERQKVTANLTLAELYQAPGALTVAKWGDPAVQEAVEAYETLARDYRDQAAKQYGVTAESIADERAEVAHNLLQTRELSFESGEWVKLAVLFGVGLSQDVILGAGTVSGAWAGAAGGTAVAPGWGTVGGYVGGGLGGGLASMLATRLAADVALKSMDSEYTVEDLFGPVREDAIQVMASLAGAGAGAVLSQPMQRAVADAVVDVSAELVLKSKKYVRMRREGASWNDVMGEVQNDAAYALAANVALQAVFKQVDNRLPGPSRTRVPEVEVRPVETLRVPLEPGQPPVEIKIYAPPGEVAPKLPPQELFRKLFVGTFTGDTLWGPQVRSVEYVVLGGVSPFPGVLFVAGGGLGGISNVDGKWFFKPALLASTPLVTRGAGWNSAPFKQEAPFVRAPDVGFGMVKPVPGLSVGTGVDGSRSANFSLPPFLDATVAVKVLEDGRKVGILRCAVGAPGPGGVSGMLGAGVVLQELAPLNALVVSVIEYFKNTVVGAMSHTARAVFHSVDAVALELNLRMRPPKITEKPNVEHVLERQVSDVDPPPLSIILELPKEMFVPPPGSE